MSSLSCYGTQQYLLVYVVRRRRRGASWRIDERLFLLLIFYWVEVMEVMQVMAGTGDGRREAYHCQRKKVVGAVHTFVVRCAVCGSYCRCPEHSIVGEPWFISVLKALVL